MPNKLSWIELMFCFGWFLSDWQVSVLSFIWIWMQSVAICFLPKLWAVLSAISCWFVLHQVDIHNDILGEISEEMERADGRLARETRNMKVILKKSRTHWCLWLLIVLLMISILVVSVVKTWSQPLTTAPWLCFFSTGPNWPFPYPSFPSRSSISHSPF